MSSQVIVTVDVGYGTTTSVHKNATGEYEIKTFPSVPIPVKSDINLGISGEERDVVTVDVNGITYEIGADVTASSARNVRVLNTESFLTSDRYKALLLGSLSFIGSGDLVIDVLVLGLPVSVLSRKNELIKIYTGTHDISGSGKRKISIKSVLVFEQPLGALMSYLREGGTERYMACKNLNILVIDPGYLTLDFITSTGIKVNKNRSGDSETGMSKVISAVELSLKTQLSEKFNLKSISSELIDQAFITGSLKLYGTTMAFPVCEHQFDVTSAITATCDEAITSVVNVVGDGQDIDLILVSGGAASVYLGAIKKAFPHHKIEVVIDPLTSVARGLQTAGEQYIKGALARGEFNQRRVN
ncbi:plasmid segregation protein ParM [Shewanella sp. SM101]|jgi:plasmid segregation protein ParM|uniref:ParM/StbA family protein n=2 Tax=Shewanellaceae TaxID=267890 RepID=UPI0002112D95|nr:MULTISPECIES: plasmid segregation protein ParM domain-containing protein [Shewanella]AEH16236.1 hypothetical protein Sbal117_4598 [Shewanella baltica OS117]MCU8008959.1 plasmid segregation protein ParM [Shewanella sp. SM87]MCU8106910.1 plasmid segregation protein ParM [Shewanella sp. SM101]